jgi:hypothetical protein
VASEEMPIRHPSMLSAAQVLVVTWSGMPALTMDSNTSLKMMPVDARSTGTATLHLPVLSINIITQRTNPLMIKNEDSKKTQLTKNSF